MKLTDLFPLFTGMFFASSVAITDGGGAEVTDTGGGSDESIVTDGAGQEDGQIADDTAGGAEATDNEVDAGADAGTQPDGRTLPNAIKQAFAKLKEIDPKAADLARKAYYEAGDYKAVFPSVSEARDVRDLLESVGGTEGISGMQKEVQDYAGELTRFSQGDPQAVEDLARDFPQGLVKLTPLAVQKLQSLDAPAYERMTSGIIASTLRDKGVAHSISRVIELIGDGKQKDAHALATEIANWIDGVDRFAKTRPQNEENPEAKALKEERAKLDQEKKQTFTGRVGASVLGEINKAISAQLAPYLKNTKLTTEQQKSLMSGIRSHLTRGFESNQPYQQRMKALVAQGDEQAILRYVRGQLASDRVLKSIKAEWATRGFANKPKSQANGAAPGVTFGTKPSSDLIDWSKDPKRMRYIGDGENGEATLKSGRVIKFKHS